MTLMDSIMTVIGTVWNFCIALTTDISLQTKDIWRIQHAALVVVVNIFHGRMVVFVQKEQPATTVLMVLPIGWENYLLHAAQNHAGAEAPIALLELPATCAVIVPIGIGGRLVNTAMKSPNPLDE
jgi:hypothetical protein